MKENSPHLPVLLQEVVSLFHNKSLDTFFDGTTGAGGHALAILQDHPELSSYVACDQDPTALELAKSNLADFASKIQFVHSNFSRLTHIAKELNLQKFDGFFLTLACHPCNLIKQKKGLVL